MLELMGGDDEAALWERWLACEWVRAFERGHCTPEEFAAGVVADWELPISGAEYLAQFAAWIGGPLDGADQLVRDTMAAGPRVGCLSNTNSIHYDLHWSEWALLDHFEPQ